MVDLVPDGRETFATNLAGVRLFTCMSPKMEFQVCFFRELSLAVLALVLFNFFLMVLLLMELKLLLISKNFFAARIFTGEAALEGMYLLSVCLQVLSKFELSTTSREVTNKLPLNELCNILNLFESTWRLR